MPHVTQHVVPRHNAAEGRKFGQLVQLGPPLVLVRQIHIGAELDGLELFPGREKNGTF